MLSFEQFTKKKYLSLETFRKNGEGVKTPVWFVQEGDALYVKTFSSSGKVKRIRNNQLVNVVPSKVDGKPLGSWNSGTSRVIQDQIIERKLNQLFTKKYGLLNNLFFRSKPGKIPNHCILEIKPNDLED